jgi:hypothetical protein
MKRVVSLFAAVALLVSGVAVAEEIKSGLKEGANIGAFYVTKCAGAEADGVEIGKNLCYRCKNGSRPQVMIFTRSSDDKVVKLVKAVDEQLKKHEDAQLRAFVNVLGESKDEATQEAKKLAKSTKAEHVPFVVPNEVENGPDDYGINAKADVTIIIANASKVVANHAVASAGDLDVEAVVASLKKALN